MRRGLLLFLILALLALPLALALQDLSRVLLTELMRLIWLLRHQLASIPQTTMWGVLLMIVLIGAASSLLGSSRALLDADARPDRVPGQLLELSRWIRRANESRYFRWTLNRYMSNLVWEVMAYREHTTPRRLKQRFRAGEFELPPDVAHYVESGGLLRPTGPTNLWTLLLRRRTRSEAGRPPPGTMEEVVRFLEEQLEVEHDLGAS